MRARGRYKPPGEPRRADILPRGLVMGPALNTGWAGDPISGLGKVSERSPLGFPFLPTIYGMGAYNWWSFHVYRIPGATTGRPQTREFLVYTGSSPSVGKTLAKEGSGTDWYIEYIAGPKIKLNHWDGSYQTLTSTTTIAANTLYHVVYTNSGAAGANVIKLYINGVLEDSKTIGTASWSGDYYLGSDGGDDGTILMATAAVGAEWTIDEVRERYREPYSHLEWDDDWRRTFGPTSASLSISLTGIGSTFSAGTLIASRSLPLTGSAITGSAGTLLPTRSLPLTGSAATASAGTVTASRSLPLTGSAATATPGTLTANRSLPITGSASTLSAGTVTPARTLALSGQALSSAAGTVATSRVLSITGLAITSAAGTVTPGLAVAIAGAAMTLSAGSLAYSARFTLVGIGTVSASGAVGVSGGATTGVDAALTGIQMRVLPGNVKVTGGTRWSPSQPAAVVPPSMVGNSLQPPPRLTGNAEVDTRAIQQWLATLYDKLIKEANVLGRLADHEKRLAAIEAANDNRTT